MKKQRYLITNIVLGVLALVVFLAGATSASAATSANATIHNVVGVEWLSGTTVYHQAASADVTVATVASLPTIFQNPANRTVANLTAVDYHTVITSNANGPDTYNFAHQAETLVNIGAGTAYTYPVTSQQLWGGIIVGSNATGNTIYLPGGSIITGSPGTANSVDPGMYLVINGNLYTVNAVVSVGNAAAGATAGATPTPLTAEVLAQVTLTPVATPQWGFGAGVALSGTFTGTGAPSGLIGVQVGQAVDVDNFSFTTANPTNPALTATYTSPFTVTTAAGNLAGALLTTPTFNFVTTVQMATLTINKYFRVITGGSAGTPTATVDVTSPASIATTFTGGSPKPGEYVEYCIVVHNTGLGDATTNVIKDPLPPYTTYATGTTSSNTNHAVGSVPLSSVADVAGSSVVQTIGGYAFTPISAGNYAVIVYQLRVN